jgi:putative tryptophan/tyrosine transport system substrate-binding protein
MKRREFIAFAGVALAQICVAHAQPDARVRRIGFLSGVPVEDPLSKARLDAFLTEMNRLGWINGHNMHMDYRAGARNPRGLQQLTEDLLALGPDVILVNGTESAEPLRQATRNVPVVFVEVSDPVGAGLVASLPRPGGNITGFANLEFGMTGKWLELLKEIAPNVTRVGVLRDSANLTAIAQLAAMQSVARTLSFDVQPLNLREAEGIERDISAFARDPNGGLILTVGSLGIRHRDLIVGLAARHRLPAVYPYRFAVAGGGLASLGSDSLDTYRRAAGYVDRILKGEKPSDLPVQNPVKFEVAINLKTAKALGLTVPPTLLARADEVIE